MNSFVLITSVQYVKVGCKEMRGDVGGLARQKIMDISYLIIGIFGSGRDNNELRNYLNALGTHRILIRLDSLIETLLLETELKICQLY